MENKIYCRQVQGATKSLFEAFLKNREAYLRALEEINVNNSKQEDLLTTKAAEFLTFTSSCVNILNTNGNFQQVLKPM